MIAVAHRRHRDLLASRHAAHFQKRRLPRWWIPLAAIPVVVLFLLLSHLAARSGICCLKCRFLQYPWRWLEAVEAPMAIFFVAAIWPRTRRQRARQPSSSPPAPRVFIAATLYAAEHLSSRSATPKTPSPHRSPTTAPARALKASTNTSRPTATLQHRPTGLPDACLVTDPSHRPRQARPRRPRRQSRLDSRSGHLPGHIRWPRHGSQTNPEHRKILATQPLTPAISSCASCSYPAWTHSRQRPDSVTDLAAARRRPHRRARSARPRSI